MWSSGFLRATALLCCTLSATCGRQPGVDPAAARCRTLVAADGDTPAVRWLATSDSVERRTLDAYCAAVGPALVMRGDTPQVAHTDTLVLINWNMELGMGDLRTLIADLRSGSLGVASEQFILLLQEVPRASPAVPHAATLPEGARTSALDPFGEDISTIARDLRLHLVYAPSMRNGLAPDEDQGNAILSSLPLHDPQFYELPAGTRRRVAVSAAVRWPDGSDGLRLISVHLDNWSLAHAIGSFGAIRARQARGLAAMLPPRGAVLLGGDLNTWARGPREAAVRALRGQLPRPARIDPEPTARRLSVPRKLDYFLLRAPASWHFEERRSPDRYGSDHHPLLGVLFLQPTVPAAGPPR